MDRRPVALTLACLAEVLLTLGALAHHTTDPTWVVLAALGLTVAALGIAGCAHLGLRRWGPRVALVGFVAQGAWLFGPPAYAVIGASALSTLGLALAAGAPRRDRLAFALAAVGFTLTLAPSGLLGVVGFVAAIVYKLRWVRIAAREAPVMPVDAHVVVGKLSRSVWLRCAPGIAFGVLVLAVPRTWLPDRLGEYAFIALFGATAIALAAFALRAFQLAPVARLPLTLAGALAAWSAAVFVGHTLAAYADAFGWFGPWDPDVLFVLPQLATMIATTLAMVAVGGALARDGHAAAAGHVYAAAVLTATLSLIAVMSIGCLIALHDESDLGALGVILATGTLHLLSSGLAANALAAAARTFVPNELPRATVRGPGAGAARPSPTPLA